MPSWFEEVIAYNPLVQLGCSVWNWCMRLVGALFALEPTEVGEGLLWADLTVNIYPVFLSVGVTLMCIFFLIGFCKESADLRQNLTFEKTVFLFLRVVAANFLLTTIMTAIPKLFRMASGLSILDFEATELDPIELSLETGGIFKLGRINIWFLSMIFLLAACICGLVIVLTVYKRYLNLMLLVVLSPVALSTASGGSGFSRTAEAWGKTFLAACFEIVVVSIALRLGCRLISDGHILTKLVELDAQETALLEMIFSMVLLVSTVKGAEGLLRRAFAM